MIANDANSQLSWKQDAVQSTNDSSTTIKILGSESFARWLVSLALVLALEIELVLVLDIERYCITASVNHLTCSLPPHQSVI